MVGQLDMSKERQENIKFAQELMIDIKWHTTNNTIVGICTTPIYGIDITESVAIYIYESELIAKTMIECMIVDKLIDYIKFARGWNTFCIETSM